jgi:hypothetical protein
LGKVISGNKLVCILEYAKKPPKIIRKMMALKPFLCFT